MSKYTSPKHKQGMKRYERKRVNVNIKFTVVSKHVKNILYLNICSDIMKVYPNKPNHQIKFPNRKHESHLLRSQCKDSTSIHVNDRRKQSTRDVFGIWIENVMCACAKINYGNDGRKFVRKKKSLAGPIDQHPMDRRFDRPNVREGPIDRRFYRPNRRRVQ